MRFLYITLALLLSLSSYSKKRPDVKRADKYFEKQAYEKAITEYERLNRREKAKAHVSMRLAISYNTLGQSVQAANYYSKAITANPDVEAEVYYTYAQNVLRNGRYEVADAIMKKFTQQADPNDPRVADYYAFKDDLSQIKDKPDSYLIAESGINDLYYDDFGITKSNNDTVYFVSNRTKYKSPLWRSLFEVKDKKTGKPNYDIYQAEFKDRKDPLYNITRVEGKVNKRFNDGIASATVHDDVLYFASDSYRNRKFRKNKAVKKRNEMKSLYSAQLKGKQWKKIKVLPFCEAGVIYTNPSVSPDGSYLYFSSNREGSIGKLDIWRVALVGDGTFGEPENLGTQVNRGGVEDYAFVSTDNMLYFASDRWGGFGGLDVYQIDLNNLSSKATNLGAPINSAKDDYNFGYFPNQKIGYISSNRIGRQDVYRIYPLCNYPINFKVADRNLHTVIANASVVLKDDKQNVLYTGSTDQSGQVSFSVDCGKFYRVEVKHSDFVSTEKDFQAVLTGDSHTVDLLLLSLKFQKEQEVLLKQQELKIEQNKIVLKDIEFAFDKTEVPESGKQELDKLVVLLKSNPTMRVQINAYTDKTGKEKYNMKLSRERAANTAKYLYDQGIDVDRVLYKGYGETKPKVDCDVCTDEQNAQNRRSEFLILNK